MSEKDTKYLIGMNENVVVRNEVSKIATKSLLQIIFCTRTHSQISQFVQELRKTYYSTNTDKRIKCVPICSRSVYCINDKISKLKNIGKINEKCQEYLDKGKCEYAGKHIIELKNTIMTSPLDIEEICKTGKLSIHCPYLATLQCMEEADVIAVPYQCILHKSTREALGISLKSLYLFTL